MQNIVGVNRLDGNYYCVFLLWSYHTQKTTTRWDGVKILILSFSLWHTHTHTVTPGPGSGLCQFPRISIVHMHTVVLLLCVAAGSFLRKFSFFVFCSLVLSFATSMHWNVRISPMRRTFVEGQSQKPWIPSMKWTISFCFGRHFKFRFTFPHECQCAMSQRKFCCELRTIDDNKLNTKSFVVLFRNEEWKQEKKKWKEKKNRMILCAHKPSARWVLLSHYRNQ